MQAKTIAHFNEDPLQVVMDVFVVRILNDKNTTALGNQNSLNLCQRLEDGIKILEMILVVIRTRGP